MREYDLKYSEMTEDFLGLIKIDKITTGYRADNIWLQQFDEPKLEEAERLNVILPLIKWCVENDTITEELKGELDWYYDAYQKGEIEPILAEYEKEQVINDLLWCYQKTFGSL